MLTNIFLGLITSIKKTGNLSHRGPLIVIVLFMGSLSSSILWFETSLKSGNFTASLTSMILNILYALTLILRGKSEKIVSDLDIQSSPTNVYHRLSFDHDEEAYTLGTAYEGSNFLSRLFFSWVNPLIEKGVRGKLRKNDDLFDLPENLNVRKVYDNLKNSLDAARTLFRALHKSFGLEFYSIGLLQLMSSLLSFIGPLLLGGLLQTGADIDPQSEDNPSKLAYYYAGALFASTVLASMAGVHFNWKISVVTIKMRTSLVSAIYAKGLNARGLDEATPEILNLMSTDTDRIVNSCISFHSFWSIPFQLFATLYLLYTQLGVAFVFGVAFAVILIPVNRYIAQKIGALSMLLMGAKDKRVQMAKEAMTGAKQIKLQSLEDVFKDKIEELRKEELVYLSKRKYLDAW